MASPESAGTEEQRPESAEESVARSQVGRPLSTSAQDEPLLLEHEILGDHRADAAGATQLGGHDGLVQQREPDVHRDCGGVEQTLGGMQRCPA
jgi:hypothetical protein